jgi:Tol biopolymer transport system component
VRRLAAAALLVLVGATTTGAAPRAAHVARIAFAAHGTIWVTDGEGRHRRAVARGDSAEISPDGNWVVFRRNCAGGSCLFLVAASGGRARLLATGFYGAAWSQDSRRLAVDGLGDDDERLYTIDRVTAARHAIAVAPRFLGFAFSPDGKQLAFAMSTRPYGEVSDIYAAASDGGALQRVTWDDRSSWPIWAPDGSIDFSRREGPLGCGCARDALWGTHRIWRIRADGSDRRLVTTHLRPGLTDTRLGLQAVAWSQDGRTLLAASPTHNGDYVYVVDQSGTVRSLGDHGYLGYASPVGISRDGRSALVWIEDDGPDSRRTTLELVPSGGGRPRVLARDVDFPSWTG